MTDSDKLAEARALLADPVIAAHIADLARDDRRRQDDIRRADDTRADQRRQDDSRRADDRRADQQRQDDLRRSDERRRSEPATHDQADPIDRAAAQRAADAQRYAGSRSALEARDAAWSEQEKADARKRAEKALPRLASDAALWRTYESILVNQGLIPPQTPFSPPAGQGDPAVVAKRSDQPRRPAAISRAELEMWVAGWLEKSVEIEPPVARRHHVKIDKPDRQPPAEPQIDPGPARDQAVEQKPSRGVAR